MSDRVPLIAVIGGGMAGLGAAHALETLRRAAAAPAADPATAAPFDWVLFERADYLGGKVRTERIDGFVIEGGPDSFIVEKPWPMELARAVGVYDRLLDSNEDIRKSYVFSGGRLHELPEGLILMVPTRLVPFALSSLISWRGKLRIGLDLLLPRGRGDEDESLGVFVRRRLGREALAKVAEPIVAGIHAGDPEQMSVQATFPMFLEMERHYRSLIIGMIRRRRARARAARPRPAADFPASAPIAASSAASSARSSATSNATSSAVSGAPEGATSRRPRSYFLSFRTGLADLVDAVVADLPADHLRTGLAVDALTLEPAGVSGALRGQTLEAAGTHGAAGGDHPRYRLRLSDGTERVVDAVVLAGPAFAAGELLQEIDPSAAADLASIAYVSTATVSLAYRRADVARPLHGFGFVVPRAEERGIMAGTFSSLKFSGRAPADGVLVRAFVGRAGREETAGLPDDALVKLVRDELASIVGLRAEPLFTRIFRWPRGMPQYRVGHRRLIDRVETAIADLPGIEIAGGYLHGIGIGDCIREGAAAAGRAAAHVRCEVGPSPAAPPRTGPSTPSRPRIVTRH
jgi:oxygen-dependent protoporphyrinogen oxidase